MRGHKSVHGYRCARSLACARYVCMPHKRDRAIKQRSSGALHTSSVLRSEYSRQAITIRRGQSPTAEALVRLFVRLRGIVAPALSATACSARADSPAATIPAAHSPLALPLSPPLDGPLVLAPPLPFELARVDGPEKCDISSVGASRCRVTRKLAVPGDRCGRVGRTGGMGRSKCPDLCGASSFSFDRVDERCF